MLWLYSLDSVRVCVSMCMYVCLSDDLEDQSGIHGSSG